MHDAVLAGFRKDFQEARRFIELIRKFQALRTGKNGVKFLQACKAKDYENARHIYLQTAREARV